MRNVGARRTFLSASFIFVVSACAGAVDDANQQSSVPSQPGGQGASGQPGQSGAPAAPGGPSNASPGGGTNAPQGASPGGVAGGNTSSPSTGSGCEQGFSQLPNGKGGMNFEQICVAADSGFDKSRSLAAFQSTVYPLLRENCAGCHSTDTRAQAPIHSDVDAALAHEYALTRVNFRAPADSKLVVRMGIDRHNCFGAGCKDANARMLAAVQAWAAQVADMLPATPRPVAQGVTVSEAEVNQWIAAHRASLPAADAQYVKYTSLHELHNAGVSAEELNVARVAISKVLNSTARWAPQVVNPRDINDKGLVYAFDIRNYWGYNKGVKKLFFGGSDDDLFFGSNKKDVEGNAVNSAVMNQRYNFAASISEDPAFAQLIWKRVLYGNVEGAVASGTIPANIAGFKPEYVEATQLAYTLTRPDVYNAIMAIPWYANELEDELGVVRDKGMDSYQYVVVQQAITVDSRLLYRARTKSGFYWKTFDVFTGQNDTAHPEKLRFPFWANPIPKFISGTGGGVTANSLSFIATLAQPLKNQIDGNAALTQSCEPQPNYGGADTFYNCRYYTGQAGLQQSAEESIWDMPNGLQGYALFGGFNQRRVDAFVNIVRDPRIQRTLADKTLTAALGFAGQDLRLNEGGSCIGCHIDGMNRLDNDLRDWLDANTLPTGPTGADSWLGNEQTKARVRELYPPSSELRPQIESDRRIYLGAMAKIRAGMVLGADKNVYVEPIVWSFEWAQKHYKYAITRSN